VAGAAAVPAARTAAAAAEQAMMVRVLVSMVILQW
jgi:hypothetical protein